jgi:hypothetical protein
MKKLSALTLFFALSVIQANTIKSAAALTSAKSDEPMVQECVPTPDKPCGNIVELDSLVMPTIRDDKKAYSEQSEVRNSTGRYSEPNQQGLFFSTLYITFLNHSLYTSYYKFKGSYSGYWPSYTGIY